MSIGRSKNMNLVNLPWEKINNFVSQLKIMKFVNQPASVMDINIGNFQAANFVSL